MSKVVGGWVGGEGGAVHGNGMHNMREHKYWGKWLIYMRVVPHLLSPSGCASEAYILCTMQADASALGAQRPERHPA